MLSTASLINIEHVIGGNSGARGILEKDYAAVIRKKLDDVYRNTGSVAGGKAEKAQQENFIVRFLPFSSRRNMLTYNSIDSLERFRCLGLAYGTTC